MPASPQALELLSAMITPAVLISACGTLIFSTAARLSRVVDRARTLTRQLEQLYASDQGDFVAERRQETEQQLSLQARRSRLIQRSLTALYVSLGFFVACTISIGLAGLLPRVAWMPTVLGIAGTLVLFYGCMLFIGETRLALRSIDREMAFSLHLRGMYQARHGQPKAPLPQP
jgi:threonine/homoserine/homoserine lactone efflux protein